MVEIVCSHSSGDYRFSPKANESFTVNPGGIVNNDDESSITGNGKMIQQKNMTLWSVEGPVAVDMKSGYEKDSLKTLMKSSEEGVWTFVHISGTIYKGSGVPVGAYSFDSNTAQATLKIAGGGELEEI